MPNLPAHLANRGSRGITQAAVSGLGTTRPAHISILGGRFTLWDNAGNSRPTMLTGPKGYYLDFVVVDANPNDSRLYYPEGFDPDDPTPPVCFSDNGTGPSNKAIQPQARTCAECEWSKWGSAVSKFTGEPIPACRSNKKLAVVVVGDDSELVYEFVIPPGSWNDKQNGWKVYGNSIGAQMLGSRQAELTDVITRVFFVPGKTGTLGFEPVTLVTPELAELQEEVWGNQKELDRICGKLDVARDPAKPLPVAGAPTPAAQPQPQQQPLQPPPQQIAQPAAQAQSIFGAQPSAPVAPKKRGRGRPPESERKAAAATQPIQAPFLEAQSAPVNNATQQVSQPATTSGMAMPATPDDALQAALTAAFKT